MNYQLSIDVKKINGAFIKEIQGKTASKECICIPTDNFFKGKDGQLYLNIDLKDKATQYSTHYAKQQLLKDKYAELSEEQKKQIPIIGNMQVSKFQDVQTVQAEEVQTTTAPPQNTYGNKGDDTPF